LPFKDALHPVNRAAHKHARKKGRHINHLAFACEAKAPVDGRTDRKKQKDTVACRSLPSKEQIEGVSVNVDAEKKRTAPSSYPHSKRRRPFIFTVPAFFAPLSASMSPMSPKQRSLRESSVLYAGHDRTATALPETPYDLALFSFIIALAMPAVIKHMIYLPDKCTSVSQREMKTTWKPLPRKLHFDRFQ
jgi:hypothetical protein